MVMQGAKLSLQSEMPLTTSYLELVHLHVVILVYI